MATVQKQSMKPQNNSTARNSSLYYNSADIVIPETAGAGKRKIAGQKRSLTIYSIIHLLGLYAFFRFSNPRIRTAGLGLIFPGAGFAAVATIPSVVCLVFTIAIFPAALFAWFACGGLLFPISIWTGAAIIAAGISGNALYEPAAPICSITSILLIVIIRNKSIAASASGRNRRSERNRYLVEQVNKNQNTAARGVEVGTRELDLRTLRFVQYVIETGLLPHDDWSRHTIIDQFQTAALRYQLYGIVYSLQLYQCHYVPNYSGAIGEACVNALIKAQCKKVNSFWKWENIWGKLNFFDWNPITRDNIMVTGYISLALALYDGNTRDYRFREKDCMEFVVTERHKYKTSFPDIVKAVFQNMNRCNYTLYPCEPHWIYTPCNLFGINGVIAADRTLKTNYADKLHAQFVRSLEEEFSETDGAILPVRSKLTGFTIPGICGVSSDCTSSLLCSSYIPHIAHRIWAIVRREAVRYDKNGKMDIASLSGADTLDAGNYKHTEGAVRVLCAQAAGEFGDKKLRDECLDQLDTIHNIVQTTSSGALYNKNLSTFMQTQALQARLLETEDWMSMITKGVPDICFQGPLLAHVPFPDVLVAKAWSHDGKGLELVLYNGSAPGDFELEFERLRPYAPYIPCTGGRIIADELGKAKLIVKVDGRTHITLSLE